MSASRSKDSVADADAEVGMLVSMGFSAKQARKALEMNDGNIDGALDTLLLLSGREPTESTSTKRIASDDGIKAAVAPKTAYEAKRPARLVDSTAAGDEEVDKRRHLVDGKTASSWSRLRQHDDDSDDAIAKPNAKCAEHTAGALHETSMKLPYSTPSLAMMAISNQATSQSNQDTSDRTQAADSPVNQGRPRQAALPGAFAVNGADASLNRGGDDEYTYTYSPASQTPSSIHPVSARLVPGGEEDVQVLQEQLRQQGAQLQRVLDTLENAAVAQVVVTNDEEAPPPTTTQDEDDASSRDSEHSANPVCTGSSRIKWASVAIVAVLVVMIITVVSVAVSSSKSSGPTAQFWTASPTIQPSMSESSPTAAPMIKPTNHNWCPTTAPTIQPTMSYPWQHALCQVYRNHFLCGAILSPLHFCRTTLVRLALVSCLQITPGFFVCL